MKRTSKGIEFENTWRNIRHNGKLVPLKSNLTPQHFKNFLPLMAIADVDIDNGSVVVRLAGTAIREIIGIEVTGMDFMAIHPDVDMKLGIERRKMYHDHPIGRSEMLHVNFKSEMSMDCELTILPIYGANAERMLAILLTPLGQPKLRVREAKELLSIIGTDGVSLDIGAGVYEY
jgi:hypothetical protein